MEEEREYKIVKLVKKTNGKAKDPKVFHHILRISKKEDIIQCEIIDKVDEKIIESFSINNDNETLINFDKWFVPTYPKYAIYNIEIPMEKDIFKIYCYLKRNHNFVAMK